MKMCTNKKIMAVMGLIILIQISCQSYLDVVPDNVATIDNAFTLRTEAEKYLSTCYSYLPKDGNPIYNIAYFAGDEVWMPYEQRDLISYAWQIARGNQNKSDPYMNAWVGNYQGGGPSDAYGLWEAIRNCNTFIENVSDLTKVRDLGIDERERWLGEVEFLKAYYHYYLLRMYGPIPIVDKNIEVSASEEEVRVTRKSVDYCVDYISNLLDSASAKLPNLITDRSNELGRVTKPIALAVKARLLLMAASPLFNGNTDYNGFLDEEGNQYFNANTDVSKWEKAAEAAKDAIEAAESAGFELYEFPVSQFTLSDSTKTQMSIRNAITERWNDEHVWGLSNSYTDFLQQAAMPHLTSSTTTLARAQLSIPIKIAEEFYTYNGVPISEDKTLDFSNKYKTRTATHSERFYISEGYETARLNFDREPRFYADLGFDGGIWYKYDSPTLSDEGTFVLEAKSGQNGGANTYGYYNETGYFLKKVVDWNMAFSSSGGATYKAYPWPEIRLAEIYLMYAEAMNEAYGPSDEALNYLDKIRNRAGLKGVAESWTNFSSNPIKFTTQNGLRDIIQQERSIELAFEGSRYWDLRRWKKSNQYLNQTITGWSVNQAETIDYYQTRLLFDQSFVAPRDYLWPIREYDITVNPNLVQNPGW